MNDLDKSIKTRAAIQERYALLVVVLLVLLVVSGWWAYQVNVVPEFDEEIDITEQWSESSDFDHQATILRDTLPWDEGEVVVNRPIYYVNVSDTLDGTYRYQYSADQGNLSVSTDIALLIRAIDGDDVFWEVTAPRAATDEDIGPDEAHTVEFTVNILDVLQIIDTVETQVGAREGLVDVRVQAFTQVDGVAEEEAVNTTHISEMSMVVNPETFRVHELETISVSHEDQDTREVLVEPSPFEQGASIGLFLLIAVLLVSLVVGQQTGQFDITEDEEELLQLEQDREEFDDWITTGTFPTERDYASTILVDDLVGLVDVAIDTNNRVIEDTQLGVSVVLEGDYVYLYVRPDSPARDWLVNYADYTIDEFENK